MSQSNFNYPQFNYRVERPTTEQFRFISQASQQSSNGSQQRLLRAPQSVQYNMPSPSLSVRSAVTDPNQSFYDRPSYHQPCDNIDPSLPGVGTHLIPPHLFHDDAWSPLHLRNSGAGDIRNAQRSSSSYKIYSPGPGSSGSVAPVSDSGYQSQSVVSNDPSRLHESHVTQSISQHTGGVKRRSMGSDAPHIVRVSPDQRSQISRVSRQSGKQVNELQCPECLEVMKCKSDYKKHELRHVKPFLCKEPGCKRNGKGFTTVNDLDRHKKSVHGIGLLEKSYQCASETCRNKGKIWPRLDNFKQHMERMHKDEDANELVKRSVLIPKQQETISEIISVAPIDTMLVGMEKPFSGQSTYESHVAPEMRDLDVNPWSAGPSPLNPYQASISLPSADEPYCSVAHRKTSSALDFQGQQYATLMQSKPYQNLQTSIRMEAINTPPKVEKKNITGHRPVAEQQKEQRRGLSNAPQSKSEQQRQALKKLSKAVSNEMDASSLDLEQLVLRLLSRTTGADDCDDEQPGNEPGSSGHGTQGNRSKVSLTKSEAIQATQMISNLIKQSPGSAYAQPRKTSQVFTANTKVCDICGYAVARECDLKKHMKRHAKPYGCTYPKCHKRFGAKSDWKRHENSQHFQLEAFRCGRYTGSGAVCGEHFFRVEPFRKHLETIHNMAKAEDRDVEAKNRRIGKNCQQQFWCGFHNEIVILEKRRNAAWDERFDHIAEHFEKGKKSIEEWVCAEENKTKKELLKEMDRYVFDDEDERGENADKPTERGSPPRPPPAPMNGTPKVSGPSRILLEGLPQIAGQKRGPSEEPSARQSKKTGQVVTTRYCCECGNGPCGLMQGACVTCEHIMEACNGCKIECSLELS